MSFGVMGADMQPQGQTQIIVNRVDYGLDIQAAGDSPRWHHQGSPQSMGEDLPGLGPAGRAAIGEPAYPKRARLRSRRLGWRSVPRTAVSAAISASSAACTPGPGVYAAASEMRADGIALAY